MLEWKNGKRVEPENQQKGNLNSNQQNGQSVFCLSDLISAWTSENNKLKGRSKIPVHKICRMRFIDKHHIKFFPCITPTGLPLVFSLTYDKITLNIPSLFSQTQYRMQQQSFECLQKPLISLIYQHLHVRTTSFLNK